MEIERLQAAYPHIAESIAPVAAAIAAMQKQKTPHLCELEARIGILVSDARSRSVFRSGVDTDTSFVSRVLCKLETSDAWTSKTDWAEQMDRYYLLPSGLEVRTSTEGFVAEDGSVTCVVSHIIKSDVAHVNLTWHGVDSKTILTSDSGVPLDIRVSVKQEEPVLEDELQDRVDDLHVVRIKHRKSFVYTSKSKLAWRMDVTQVYQAFTDVEALTLLRDGKVSSYELEVECVDPMEHLRQLDFDHNRLAASLLLKITDLFAVPGGPKLEVTSNMLTPHHV